jgi:hypothetical protein
MAKRQVIHVNQHIIRSNRKTGERTPPLTMKSYNKNVKATEISIDGKARVIYSPDKPLPCGAVVWIETHDNAIVKVQ